MPLSAAWDNTFTSNLSYSNSDKTVAFAGDGYAYSTDGFLIISPNATQPYVEVTIGALIGSPSDTYPRIGIAGKSGTPFIYLQRNGVIIGSGTYAAQAALVFNPGDVVRIAFATSNQAWFSVNGGPWNLGGTADPSNNTGGISLASISGSTTLFITAEWVGAAGPVATINTGSTPFAYAIPFKFEPLNDMLPADPNGWSKIDRSPGILITPNSKTVYRGYANGGTRSTKLYNKATPAKLYGEFLISNIPASSNTAVGISAKSVSLTTRTHYAAIGQNGNFFTNPPTINSPCLPVLVAGDVICFAWDTAGQKIWFRKGAGLWNANATHDPATGAGGWSITGLMADDYAMYSYIASSGTAPHENTVRTAAEFTQAIPAGFTAWIASAAAPKGAKVWNGSAWVTKPAKVWNGSAWAAKPVKTWNGSAWA